MKSRLAALPLLNASVLCEHGAQPLAPPPDSYWQVSPPLNYSDTLYAGWPQLAVDSETIVHRGTDFGRTYSHHPALYYDHDGQQNSPGRLYLQYSSAPIDEDATGQESWLSTSTDGGRTWSQGISILPTALLPNQTKIGPANYTYWCERSIYQRALHPSAWVPIISGNNSNDDDITLYAVSQTTIRYCWGGNSPDDDGEKGTKAAGRVARTIDRRSGRPVGEPCWTAQNEWTGIVGYPETVEYGYGMQMCAHARQIEAYLGEPATVPAWESWLYATELYAADDAHDVQEPTNAVWFPPTTYADDNDTNGGRGGGYWERFWRDISGSDIASHAVWVERTADRDGGDWYPRVKAQHGNRIYRTDMPDVGSKQHFGKLPLRPGPDGGSSRLSDRFLIHNPRNNSERLRQPLTIATSRGGDGGWWSPYRGVGVLRTGANTTVAPDTRGLKRLMFSYPTAVVVGGKLVVAYSENKENIWVSIVDIANLP